MIRNTGRSPCRVSCSLQQTDSSLHPGLVIQGTTVNLGSNNMVAVDTGTTLIGGPQSIIESIYAAIPGSERMTGAYANYYQYPCTTTIDFRITFGSYEIAIGDADFNLGRYSSDETMCTGAVYIQGLSSSSPVQWIVGDTALKNVYSVYRFNPPAVGFAALPGAASSATGSTTIPNVSTLPAGYSSENTPSATSSTPSTSTSRSGSASATTTATPSVVVVTVDASDSPTTTAAQTSSPATQSPSSAQRPSAGTGWVYILSSIIVGSVIGGLAI
jgi:cathepsin D